MKHCPGSFRHKLKKLIVEMIAPDALTHYSFRSAVLVTKHKKCNIKYKRIVMSLS